MTVAEIRRNRRIELSAEKWLLVPYFHAFRARHTADSSGMRTLSELLGRPLPELRREWEGYVSGLRLAR